MNKAEEWDEKEEKVLAELDELKHIGGWHKYRIAILKEYASEERKEAYNKGLFDGVELVRQSLLKQKEGE